jgi:hypothetical protein
MASRCKGITDSLSRDSFEEGHSKPYSTETVIRLRTHSIHAPLGLPLYVLPGIQ